MAERISALRGHAAAGHFGLHDTSGVILSVPANLQLHQVAAWPESLASVAQIAAASIGERSAAAPGKAVGNSDCAMLRVEPLKWWLIGAEALAVDPQLGATLDLSHSRTCIRISGDQAAELLGRLLPLDLREQNFPINSVASSALHHVGVSLWRNEQGYDLLVPRGFAVSVWEIVFQTALEFGVEVV